MTATRTLIYVFLALAVASVRAQNPVFAERVVTVSGNFSIEADPADQAYVQALIQKLAQPRAAQAAPTGHFSLAELTAQRTPILKELATRAVVAQAHVDDG